MAKELEITDELICEALDNKRLYLYEFKCPVCGANHATNFTTCDEFMVWDSASLMLENKEQTFRKTETGRLLLALICGSCGYLLPFAVDTFLKDCDALCDIPQSTLKLVK